MSMAQDSAPYHYGSDVGSRYHARQGSASSVLAVTTFGVPYNPLATPSNVSAYGSVSWPSSHNVSPSIWSQNHQGSMQWPSAVGQERSNVPTYYGHAGNYPYAPRMYGHMGYAQPPPQQQVIPAVMQQGMPQQQPILMVPQIQHVSHMQPPMQAPVMAPVMAPSMAHPSFAARAPLQPYQSIAPPTVSAPLTEYDISLFSKFFVSVAIDVILNNEDSMDSESLEQFVSTLLCATRLPKSTVLMGLVFLNRWDKNRRVNDANTTLKNQVICSLMLANKMNDDNTFTNASWGLVCGVPAKQLTKLELSWLDALNWSLTFDENGNAEWNYWQKCWNQYEQQQQGPRTPLSPVGGWTSSGFVFEPFSVAAC